MSQLDGVGTRYDFSQATARSQVPARATIHLVAQAAQVATSTVSRVLNGGYVSAPVRARVTQAVRDLNYFPSFTARSLKAGRSGRIGVVCVTSQDPWFADILAGIDERLALTRQSVLLASLVLNGRYDATAVADWIRLRHIDGLIFVRCTPDEQGLLLAAETAGLPVVLIGPDVSAKVSCTVRCDNVQAGKLVGQHLLEHGHRRVAFAGGPRESIDTRDRLRGLSEALSQQGVVLLEEDVSYALDYSYTSGIQAAGAFLSRSLHQRPSCVVLGNDAMALGFMRTVLQHGVEVPRDLSVVGFDGIPLGATYWPGLTTVAQPAQLMGSTGCQALLECIYGKHVDSHANFQFGAALICRESTAPPAQRVPGCPPAGLHNFPRAR